MAKTRQIQVPGDPVTEDTADDLPDADNQSDPVTEDTADDLPDADSIDAATLKDRVLTRQGWLLPNGGTDVQQ